MNRVLPGLLSAVFCFAATPRTGELPLQFEPNVGQAGADVRYFARTADSAVFITDAGLRILPKGHTEWVQLRWVGAEFGRTWKPGERLPGVSHYYDGTKSLTGVPHFLEIYGRALYPGIDLRLHGNSRSFEYDFLVAPGADPGRIAWKLPVAPTRDGEELVALGARLRKPEAWQYVNGSRVDVPVRYRVRGKEVSFQLGRFDRGLPLTIDPIIAGAPGFRTFVGGVGNDTIEDVALGAAGEVYVAGHTTTPDVISGTNTGGAAYVSKLSANGSAILYTTYINGSAADGAQGIAVDANGNVAFTGSTASTNLVLTTPFQSTNGGGATDAFVVKLSPSGTVLWSSYLGGTGDDSGYGIGFGSQGQIYVSGETSPAGFPTTPGVFQTITQPTNTYLFQSRAGFIARISSTGAKEAATYVGPVYLSQSNLVVDSADNPHIFINAENSPALRVDFFETPGLHTYHGVAKLSPDLKTLIRNLAVSQVDTLAVSVVRGFALDSAGTVYAATRIFGGGSLALLKRNLDGTGQVWARPDSPIEDATGVEKVLFEPRRMALSQDGQTLWIAGSDFRSTTSAGNLRTYNTSDLKEQWKTRVQVGSSTTFNGVAVKGTTVVAAGNATAPYPAGGTSATPGAGRTIAEGNEGLVGFWQSTTCGAATGLNGPSSIAAAGETITIQVTTAASCPWELYVGANPDRWTVVEGGVKNVTRVEAIGPVLKLKFGPNGSTTAISFALTLGAENLTIMQAPISCTLSAGAAPVLTGSTGTASIPITSSPNVCEWKTRFLHPLFETEVTAPSWLSVTPSGTGSGPLQLTWTANPTALSRTATIQVYGLYNPSASVTVTQPGATCTVTLNKAAQAMPASGGLEGVDLATNLQGCSLNAVSSADWLVPIIRSGRVEYRVTTNQSTSARIASLTIEGKVLTVSQAGSAGCTFTASPASLSPPANGGSSDVTLTASSPACGWYAFPRIPGVNIYPEAGRGTATLKVTFAPNYNTTSRTGNLDIAGLVVSSNQTASTEPLTTRYFRMLYFSLFGRHPSDAELAGWQVVYASNNSTPAALDDRSHNVTRGTFYESFLRSTEFHETARFCAGLYIGLLDRDPEIDGWRFQRDSMRAGIVNGVSIVSAFLNSAEYKSRWGNPSDSEFIRLLYRYVLLREASEYEVAGHVATLANLSRTTVAYNFLHAQEYYDRIGPRLNAFLLGAVLRQRDNTPGERQLLIDNPYLSYPYQSYLSAASIMASEDFKSQIR